MFENPDNERRVNELEVEVSELKDHVDKLHDLKKNLLKVYLVKQKQSPIRSKA